MAAPLPLVLALFALTGATGLIYELVWVRLLTLVLGATVHAVSTVLAVFMGGMALGSWLFGRLVDRRRWRGLRLYGALEVAVGLYALVTPSCWSCSACAPRCGSRRLRTSWSA